jgi:hypothetical protein
MRVHAGYELTDKDHEEIRLLHERFGVDPPSGYEGRILGLAERFDQLQPLPLAIRDIFGSEDSDIIGAALALFCQERLGARPARILFLAVSVGVVCGVLLEDGRHVVIKAHQRRSSLRYLTAVQSAQRSLAAAGVPAPEPLTPPTPLGRSLGTAETLLSKGVWADPHAPSVGAAMASALVRLAAAGRSLTHLGGLGAGPMETAPGALWPTPHDPRFDFSLDVDGAAWIDRLAREARDLQRPHLTEDPVVGHTDWRVQNMRFDDHGQVCAVYDWDSLRILPEPMLAGKQAANFTADWSRELDRQYPTIQEALDFMRAYEAARETPFDDRQWRVARASLVYALAHISRCEHSDEVIGVGGGSPRRDNGEAFPPDSARALLETHGKPLLADG